MRTATEQLLLLFLIFGATQWRSAHACSCIGPFTVEAALERTDTASVVWIGSQQIVPDPTIPNGNQFVFYRSYVQRVFKGCGINPYRPLFVQTGGNSALCGITLETYRYYALFGSVSTKDVPGYGPSQVLSIGACDANTKWGDLEWQEKRLLRSQRRSCWN